jgi:hypothetical protein
MSTQPPVVSDRSQRDPCHLVGCGKGLEYVRMLQFSSMMTRCSALTSLKNCGGKIRMKLSVRPTAGEVYHRGVV